MNAYQIPGTTVNARNGVNMALALQELTFSQESTAYTQVALLLSIMLYVSISKITEHMKENISLEEYKNTRRGCWQFRWVLGKSAVEAGRNGEDLSECRERMCEEVQVQDVGKAARASRKSRESQTCV